MQLRGGSQPWRWVVVSFGFSRVRETQVNLCEHVVSALCVKGACLGQPSDPGDLAGMALFSGPGRTVIVGPIGRDPAGRLKFSQERGLRFRTAARIVTYGSSDVLLRAGNGCRGATCSVAEHRRGRRHRVVQRPGRTASDAEEPPGSELRSDRLRGRPTCRRNRASLRSR